MHVAEISLTGFQSYRDEQRVPLARHLTLLAGRNNVGKSAVLRALAAFDQPQDGANSEFALTVTMVTDGESLAAPHREDRLPEIVRAYKSYDEHTIRARLVSTRDDGTVGPLDKMYFESIGLLELGWTVRGVPGFSAGWQTGPLTGASTAVPELAHVLRTGLSSTRYLAPPRIEPGRRSLRAETKLSQEGRNLPEVLFHLYNSEPRRYERIIAFMRGAFNEVEGITVAPIPDESTPMGEPRVLYVGREDPVPLKHCGTGVELLLRLAVAIHDAEPRLFLIDEPQAYLHPHAERELLRLIDEHREHQYVVATHSHVLLNARPLKDARLVTMEGGASRVVVPGELQEVLAEVGLTAGDVGLAERLIWVEGPADEEAFRVLQEREPAFARSGALIKPMPVSASQFAGRGRKASVAYEMCRAITSAILPLSIDMIFLFDMDEKTEREQEEIIEASRGQARFLPVREMENLYLRHSILTPLIGKLCAAAGKVAPSSEQVSSALVTLLKQHDDQTLFPEWPSKIGREADAARGSAVIDRLTWDYACTRYDKRVHGAALAALALEHEPAALDPLRAALV